MQGGHFDFIGVYSLMNKPILGSAKHVRVLNIGEGRNPYWFDEPRSTNEATKWLLTKVRVPSSQ